MFPNFTGRAGGKRKVDLSGQRNANPWAAASSTSSNSTVARAQAEREKRHQDKERLKAARRIQRVYRGYRVRRELRGSRRRVLDQLYQNEGTANRSAEALPLMLSVYQTSKSDDHQRLYRLCQDLLHDDFCAFDLIPKDQELFRLRWLARIVLKTLKQLPAHSMDAQATVFLETLCNIAQRRANAIEPALGEYYQVIGEYCRRWEPSCSLRQQLLGDLVAIPLRVIPQSAYPEFAYSFLTQRDITLFESNIALFFPHIDTDRLADSLGDGNPDGSRSAERKEDLLWLLAHLVALQRAKQQGSTQLRPPKALYSLVAALSTEIRAAYSTTEPRGSTEDEVVAQGLPPYVSNQLASLTDRVAISGLLERLALKNDDSDLDEASSLAGYVLTLVYCFPNLGDEIRMRLFLADLPSKSGRLPALKYLWSAINRLPFFQKITSSVDATLDILRQTSSVSATPGIASDSPWHQQWRTILLFLELFVFVLKLMDDNEFFEALRSSAVVDESSTRLRASGLGLNDLKRLSLFLKHLGFVLHYNAADILNEARSMNSVDVWSTPSTRTKKSPKSLKSANPIITAGIDMRSFRGLVTTAVKMLYERDSRLQFLPQDHWLMTSKFDMEGFMSAVVLEEQRQRELREQSDDETDADNDSEQETAMDVDYPGYRTAAGQRRSLYAQMESLKAQRKQVAREAHRAQVGPKLEILRNMPFVIPFDMRVRIFRKFVYLDKLQRRGGHVDADSWRASQIDEVADFFRGGLGAHSSRLSKHQAKIQRGKVFEGAMDAFWPLEEGLKEPIQITFQDEFGLTEAGIDGGGVTKEFLTSVTNEAFTTQSLFVTNSNNAYYPNPAALDQRKEVLRAAGVRENSEEWQVSMTDLLKQYEFLGRIIGKCMYEGILIDVVFTGFFLLKWATGLGSLDSSRANLNDLREQDESLYQGMLTLKNYKGDVEQDFSLDFTIEDQVSAPGEPGTRSVTRKLIPNGDKMSVTNENRLLYISKVAQHRLLVQPYAQTRAFLRGLGIIIDPSWLSMFNQNELQRLVGGDSAPVDVEDLRANTAYGGVYQIGDDGEEHPTIKLFWEVLHELDESEKKDVLKYVTSTPRAPLLGFAQLNPPFSIRDGGQDQDRLPSASTCVNLLKLPQYRTAKVLKEKLLYAVTSGAGFDLS
ncbi:hypothetical protein QBC35DRAFT_145670 [Podospora australis]|uniref:HECT-type E3 ubiquitin transferase n=1 Tax=Podospora australis TaxID=1536484 RepID=A0AAN6WWQ0_9PEZI|nr:hypothetical protein QBC35DRAFT_145670 [Podospora australis]